MVLLLMFAVVVSGCANNSTPTSPAEPLVVEDNASLMGALQNSGATVETGEPVSQDFFSPEGSIIKVNGMDVQVFEYESVETMESESSQVAPGGALSMSFMALSSIINSCEGSPLIYLSRGDSPDAFY